MSEIVIFKAEQEVENLAEKIAQSRVLAYTMPLEPWHPKEISKNKALAKELFPDWASSGANDSDLYYTKSIFVTTNWNKNTDVFDKVETWMARATPTHKPTNIEHDEKKLVGHITDCFAMTIDGQLIPDNIAVDDLPNIYHLVNGAVIYKGWRDGELATRASTLIEQIENGQKYVSMECLFSNFSYAVIDPDGKCSVVARDENSAWMTKYLRAYGGTGEYNGYKIGRLLRNITFSGKGYVDKPANPDSIIFSDAGVFDFAMASKSQENAIILNNGVYLNRVTTQNNEENKSMSSEIETLKAEIVELKAAKAAVEDKLSKADIAKSEAHAADLENQIKTKQTELDNAKAELETSKKTVEDLTAKYAESEKKFTEEKAAKAELEKKIAEMTQAQITASRITTLVEGGIEKEVAEKKVALYANLNDEQFKDIATDIVEAAAKKKKKDEEMPSKDAGCASDKENETNANEEVLENAELSKDPSLATGGEQVDETVEIRKELQNAFASRLGININNENSDKE